MTDPQSCINWDGNAEGCNCPECQGESDVIDLDDQGDQDDDECPFCEFGCSSCSPLVEVGMSREWSPYPAPPAGNRSMES